MKKKRVLILGGAGFIGLGIAKYLGENRNYQQYYSSAGSVTLSAAS